MYWWVFLIIILDNDFNIVLSGEMMGLSNEWIHHILTHAQEYIQSCSDVLTLSKPLCEAASDLQMEIIWLIYWVSLLVKTIDHLKANYESIQTCLSAPLPPFMDIDPISKIAKEPAAEAAAAPEAGTSTETVANSLL